MARDPVGYVERSCKDETEPKSRHDWVLDDISVDSSEDSETLQGEDTSTVIRKRRMLSLLQHILARLREKLAAFGEKLDVKRVGGSFTAALRSKSLNEQRVGWQGRINSGLNLALRKRSPTLDTVEQFLEESRSKLQELKERSGRIEPRQGKLKRYQTDRQYSRRERDDRLIYDSSFDSLGSTSKLTRMKKLFRLKQHHTAPESSRKTKGKLVYNLRCSEDRENCPVDVLFEEVKRRNRLLRRLRGDTESETELDPNRCFVSLEELEIGSQEEFADHESDWSLGSWKQDTFL